MASDRLKSFVKTGTKIYLQLRKLWDKIPEPTEEFRNLCMSMDFREFVDYVNTMEYQYDPLHGLLDNTYDYNKFFENRTESKDCDDFCRVVMAWGSLNGYEAKEYVVCSCTSLLKSFETFHVIGTLHKDGKYYLSNYDLYGPFDTEQEALDLMSCWETYRDERITVFYREIKIL